MRVTSETMAMRSLDRLQSRMQSYEHSQSKLATGRTLLQPSDDPSGARRSLSLRSDLRAREQESRNAADAVARLNVADTQLQAAMTRMQRVQELAGRGASLTSASERHALAVEVREIADEIAEIANTRHQRQPLFAGYTDGPAVERDPSGAWTSNGDGDEIRRRISDAETVRANITAAEWLGFDADGEDLLTTLDRLVGELSAGPAGEVSARLADLQAGADRIGDGLAVIGAAANRVESASSRNQQLLQTLRTELSDVEDVDVAEGVMELQVQQVAFEATLQAIGRALPPSLAAFLR